jgi:hypothetical protein
MMRPSERAAALQRMQATTDAFYRSAVSIGNHPFIEFAGVMAAYVKSCERAHNDGVDFTECNEHCRQALPMEAFEIDYLVEKLNCIFGGRITAHTHERGGLPVVEDIPQ